MRYYYGLITEWSKVHGYLDGIVKRIRKDSAVPVDVYIRKPGAVHLARFIASLCILKITMYLHQDSFGLTRQERNEVNILAEIIALINV